MTERPAIPEPIKRIVRARCGFSCVLCGNMITTYEHIVPYAECQEHEADNLVLLCAHHQLESTARRLSKESIRAAAANPYAFAHPNNMAYYKPDVTTAYRLWIGGQYLINKGGMERFVVLYVRDTPFFWVDFDEGVPLFSFCLLDETGMAAVQVFRNEYLFRSGLWDVTLIGQTLKVFSASRTILMEIDFVESKIIMRRAFFFIPNALVEILRDEVRIFHEPKTPRALIGENIMVAPRLMQEPLWA